MRWNRATVSVSMAKTSPREAERSNVYYARLFPPARPLFLGAVKRGLVRHEAGLAHLLRAAGAGIAAHGAQAYRTAPCRPGHDLARRPVRAAEHLPEALVQSLADLVHRADPVDHCALGR